MAEDHQHDANATNAELAAKGVALAPCVACGASDLGISPGLYELRVLTEGPSADEVIPLRVLLCNRCGHVHLFSAQTLSTPSE